jgi:hypothetical protein
MVRSIYNVRLFIRGEKKKPGSLRKPGGDVGAKRNKRRQKRFLEMTTASVNRIARPEEER